MGQVHRTPGFLQIHKSA